MSIRKLSFVSLIALLLGVSAAQAAPVRCYTFTPPSPARDAAPDARPELWCYEKIAQGTFVFNADSEAVKPELALIRHKDGRVAHGSLAGGALEIRNFDPGAFNPFAIPLEEPRGRKAKAAPKAKAFRDSAESVKKRLSAAAPETEGALRTPAGKSAADASFMPWRGYWWPYADTSILDTMAKYDDAARARGLNSAAVNWERQVHTYHGINWEGHCNGWAASSILRAEPSGMRSDSRSGRSFAVSDQKALWAEVDYCAQAAFYGYRDRDGSGIAVKDFHNVLLYYIGQLKKPVAFNFSESEMVNNNIISGYVMNNSGGYVDVTIRVHHYDGARSEITGVAPYVYHTYRYSLETDANGRAVGGEWMGSKPGFVWVPLGTGRCSHGNPSVTDGMVETIAAGM